MRSLVALFLAVMLGACASTAPDLTTTSVTSVPGVPIQEEAAASDSGDAAPAAAETSSAEEPKDEGRGIVAGTLLYLPNRVVDLFDIAKFGVDVGPGIGIDVQATKFLQARAMWNLSVGVGFQGLRHLPFQVGTVAALGVGPIGGVGSVGGWPRSDSGFRLGLHVLIVGAHAEVNPYEALDFVLGFLTIDIADDDF